MKRHLVLLTLFLWIPIAHADEVISVHDGDTITVMKGQQRIRVRLACIDAPEMSQRPYGEKSKEYLQTNLPDGSEVTLKIKATDRYGRRVAEIYKNGRNINQSMVASGNAFVYWEYIKGCDRETYSRLENGARFTQLGVWSTTGIIELPWEYRRLKRTHDTGH